MNLSLGEAQKILRTLRQEILALRKNLPDNFRKEISNEGLDTKLQIDFEFEKVILEHLRKNSSLPILSEETSHIEIRGETWIVDPLDGTFNFKRGIPCYGMSVALWNNQEPVLGTFLDLASLDEYDGNIESGCFLNQKPVRVSTVSSTSQAVLATGFPIAMDFSDHNLQNFVRTVRSFKKTRMFGSAAFSLAQVACGRVDAYFEQNIKIWDVAAGIALVKAAGGQVIMKACDRKYEYDVFASNGKLPRLVEGSET